MLKLSDIKLGETATIVSFSDEEIAENMMKMGCIPGEKVTLERIAPFGGPIIIFVAGYQLSLRKSEAEKVEVEKSQNKSVHSLGLGLGAFLVLLASLIAHPSCAQLVGDTIHITRYVITLDTMNFTAKTIRANTQLTVQAKQNNVNNITLWLLKLQIDSIKAGNQNLNFSYNDTLIRISPPSVMNQNDTANIIVYYKGSPQKDPSWGGFYFSGGYAFNLGVGFDANPHNFGRVWFPCIDEFTDRSTYDFFITTDSTKKAFCNGSLQTEIQNSNGTKTWHWKMNHAIPTYLASVAVAPFYTMYRNYNGVPVEFAILPADSNKTINTFQNLDTCLSTFINKWGNYPFDKVGYVMTPYTYGGMEHASSIHLSKTFVDGTKTYETLWAHELSHMWWGDKVTCAQQEEMWLNEGWATFNEHLFTEAVYGTDAYKSSFRTDHRRVLQFAHIEDGNYWTLNNLPHAYTYADLSVYQKGALTAHTLRNYMGDAQFFLGCKNYMNSFAYGNAGSYDLLNALSSTGTDVTDFFNGWVFTPGFPHFAIDSTEFLGCLTTGDSISPVLCKFMVHTRQKQKGNNYIYKMNVEVNFTNGIIDTNIVVNIDSAMNAFYVELNFFPSWISIDRNEKMMDAITDYENTIASPGTISFPETNVSLNVQDTGAGKSVVRIEHNWVAPDTFKDTTVAIRLSNYHYWKADGLFANGFHSKATFTYDGSNNSNTGYIDNSLITNEDSLIILYREGAWDDWKIVNGYTHNKGSLSDKKGNFVIDTLKKGEYSFGRFDYSVSSENSHSIGSINISIYPNPATALCRIEFSTPPEKPVKIVISDISGKKIHTIPVFTHLRFVDWNTYGLSPGIYNVNVFENEKNMYSSKFVKD